MKNVLFVALVTLAFGSHAMAATKTCFGSSRNDDTKGVVLSVEIERADVTIKTLNSGPRGEFDYNGRYPSMSGTTQGRDGVIYITYKGENSDYQDIIMVNPALLEQGTTGLLQIRARGEGFFNSVFVCKDPR